MFLPGESQGWHSLVGCHLWGCTELDMTEATWQQQHLMRLYWTRSYVSQEGSRKSPILQGFYETRRLRNFTAILTSFMSVNVLWSSKAQCQWMQKIRVRRDMSMPWGRLLFTCFSPILSIFPSWIPEHWALFWSFRRGLYAVRKEDNMGPLQVDSQGMMV